MTTTANYVQVVEQTDQEKLDMYMALDKEEVCRMLIQCNKYLDIREPIVTHLEADYEIYPDIRVTIATAAMQGILSNCYADMKSGPAELAQEARIYADALLAELNKPTQ